MLGLFSRPWARGWFSTSVRQIDDFPLLQILQESGNPLLALVIKLLATRNFPADSQALLANGFKVRVIDWPDQELVKVTVVAWAQDCTKGRFDIRGCKARVRSRGCAASPP
jgi:hypothetical protein